MVSEADSQSKTIEVDSKQTTYILKGLKSWENYEISLVSISKHGESSKAKAVFAVKGKRKANEIDCDCIKSNDNRTTNN